MRTRHQQAFEEIRGILANAHTMVAPSADKELLVYLAASKEAIGVLIAQEVDGQEKPVYYLRKLLKGPKLKYPQIDKLSVALIYAVTKLRHYIVTHKVKVITQSDLIKLLLQKLVLIGRYAKWMLMLSELDITVEKPKAIKS